MWFWILKRKLSCTAQKCRNLWVAFLCSVTLFLILLTCTPPFLFYIYCKSSCSSFYFWLLALRFYIKADVIIDLMKSQKGHLQISGRYLLIWKLCLFSFIELKAHGIYDNNLWFQAEFVTKKYEEKYKQVAEIASKLAMEDARFRDLQVKLLSCMKRRPSDDSAAYAP